MAFDTPILFLVFNRPETTAQVFSRIREIQPRKLFVAADGPRPGKEGEQERCEAVRRMILDGIDWPCDVQTLFRDHNLGCGHAVSGAITWFFQHVEEGIILEDDTLPDISFFGFCKELLEKYRFDEQVKMISGNNFQDSNWRGDGSYYFSAYTHNWGWASWRRTWNEYNFYITEMKESDFDQTLNFYFSHKRTKNYWKENFRKIKSGKVDTWDTQMLFSVWRERGLAIIPNTNLVTNIGFGSNATHSVNIDDAMAMLKHSSIKSVKHPTIRVLNKEADEYVMEKYYLSNKKRFSNIFKKIKRVKKSI